MTKPTENELLLRFGARLKYLRTQRGLSQEKLAEDCGLDVMTISRFENGRLSPKFGTLALLARGLQTSLKELVDFEA